MIALALTEFGGINGLHFKEFPDPLPREGEVLIKVQACALNHVDLLIMRGRPGVALPHVGGCDVAGEITEVGHGVGTHYLGNAVIVNPVLSCGRCWYCRAGEQSLCEEFRIFGRDTWGGLAEYVTVPVENVIPLPKNLSWAEAATIPVVFMTAWRLLVTKAKVQPGEKVLVWGAGGGVGSAAIQIAKLFHATVIATTRGREKRELARSLGADDVIDPEAEDVIDRVAELTSGKGVDIVVDTVGTPTWPKSLQILRKGGRLVVCGASAGPIGETDLRYLWRKQISIHGSSMANATEFETVLRMVEQGLLHPVIYKIVAFTHAKEAFREMQSAERFGKVVVTFAA